MGGKDGKSGLLEKVKGMTVESVSEKDDTITTHKKMYALSGFNVFDGLGYIVEIDQKEIDDFTLLYPNFTPTLPPTLPYTHTLIHTTTTVLSEKVNPDLPKTQEHSPQNIQDSKPSKKNTQINSFVRKTPKTGKKVNMASTDNETRKLKSGKVGLTGVKSGAGEQVKLAGVEWERINSDKINSTNVTAFCIWYCQNIDSNKTPSEIKTAAVRVFAITPDVQNTKKPEVSYLCKTGQHELCGGYACGCDCHIQN